MAKRRHDRHDRFDRTDRSSSAKKDNLVQATVVQVQGPTVEVKVGERRLRCRIRNSLTRVGEEARSRLAVGDKVLIQEDEGGGIVEEALPRQGFLSRLQPDGREQVIVANADQVVIVGSLVDPPFRPRVVDRILVASERGGFRSLIVLNKVDHVEDRAEVAAIIALYGAVGYPVMVTSAVTGEGLDALRKELKGRVSVLAGHSGVGKSSILNSIEPGLSLRTRETSKKWGKGCHTTTAAFWLDLADGGSVIDTPGIRSFSIAGLEPSDIAVFFPDLAPFVDACRFRGCTHVHEPACAVAAAAGEGRIIAQRYESYVRIIQGMDAED